MEKYEVVLFDLDGTLTDPGIGITNSVAYALEKYNIHIKEREELYRFIGPPLVDSFQNFYGFSDEQALEAVEYYREYYQDKGIFENYVYDGIPDLLETLRARGKRLIVATSKPEEFAKRIIKHYDLGKYFSYVAGATMDNQTRITIAAVIRYALDTCQIEQTEKVVMVGDRKHDVLGAAQWGIDTIGVLYGYGDREELEAAGARYIADTVEQIAGIIQ